MKKLFILLIIIFLLAIVTSAIVSHARKESRVPARKILFYRNPMNPEITSPTFKKDEMGMDYIPVYEEEAKPDTQPQGVYIPPDKQKLVGIKTEAVTKQQLSREIRTVGKIAYDPDLYVAQEEYIQALKIRNTSAASSPDTKREAFSTLDAARQKLLLLGMSEAQIKELDQTRKPQSNLYLGVNQKTVWAYISVYENEMGLVKAGLPVTITATAFPGEEFTGKVSAVNPVVDPMTRTVQARAEISNPSDKLKPGMFINAVFKSGLGKKLAVPEEAVLTTGERSVVFLATPDGYFQTKEVKIGSRAGGYYEVISGLKEGDVIVSSGNFFVDSESRLKSVNK